MLVLRLNDSGNLRSHFYFASDESYAIHEDYRISSSLLPIDSNFFFDPDNKQFTYFSSTKSTVTVCPQIEHIRAKKFFQKWYKANFTYRPYDWTLQTTLCFGAYYIGTKHCTICLSHASGISSQHSLHLKMNLVTPRNDVIQYFLTSTHRFWDAETLYAWTHSYTPSFIHLKARK